MAPDWLCSWCVAAAARVAAAAVTVNATPTLCAATGAVVGGVAVVAFALLLLGVRRCLLKLQAVLAGLFGRPSTRQARCPPAPHARVSRACLPPRLRSCWLPVAQFSRVAASPVDEGAAPTASEAQSVTEMVPLRAPSKPQEGATAERVCGRVRCRASCCCPHASWSRQASPTSATASTPASAAPETLAAGEAPAAAAAGGSDMSGSVSSSAALQLRPQPKLKPAEFEGKWAAMPARSAALLRRRHRLALAETASPSLRPWSTQLGVAEHPACGAGAGHADGEVQRALPELLGGRHCQGHAALLLFRT